MSETEENIQITVSLATDDFQTEIVGTQTEQTVQYLGDDRTCPVNIQCSTALISDGRVQCSDGG